MTKRNHRIEDVGEAVCDLISDLEVSNRLGQELGGVLVHVPHYISGREKGVHPDITTLVKRRRDASVAVEKSMQHCLDVGLTGGVGYSLYCFAMDHQKR